MEGLNTTQLESLQSREQAALLDTVDEIRRHGLNRYISLPQLIVCGDQSSGKSSVLEAISGVHFPVNDGLCTRFTTEVILRRASESLASVKLIPAKEASVEHRTKLLQFAKSSIHHDEIPTLISEAKTIMGLTGSSSFSRDILQLEVSGPNLPHLTLVDLPGLIHNANKEQTEEDVKIPAHLVRKYMIQPRSIVLAIVTAKNDTSNQIVLNMAKVADPQGLRTMGIITKPDCLIRDSPNEAAFFALASNKEAYFKLDWHVLRNGDFNERKSPDFDRDKAESDFFASGIWKNLPSSKRGVDALRTKLSHALYQQIQKELPSLLKEIEHELTACKQVLDRLGSPRDTPSSRRLYLTAMASRFHDLVQAGNEGMYQDPFFKPEDYKVQLPSSVANGSLESVVRLRAVLRREEQKFLDRMYKSGHTYEIGNDISKITFSNNGPNFVSEKTFLAQVRFLLDQSKGKELPGTFTPLLVGDLFLRQSKNWKAIATEFVEATWNMVKRFLDNVLTHVADENVRRAVLEEVIDPAMDEKLSKLKDKVHELHSPYARGYPMTLNPRFVQALEKRRSQGLSNVSSEERAEEDPDTHACRELLYLMQSYYEIALDVFVDNIASLAIENCLMTGLKDILSPLSVSEMEDEMLEAIAFESDDVRELRGQTLEKQASLQKSFELCRRQARKLASNRLSNGETQSAHSSTGSVQGSGVTSTDKTTQRMSFPKVSLFPGLSNPELGDSGASQKSKGATSGLFGTGLSGPASSSISTPVEKKAQNGLGDAPLSSIGKSNPPTGSLFGGRPSLFSALKPENSESPGFGSVLDNAAPTPIAPKVVPLFSSSSASQTPKKSE